MQDSSHTIESLLEHRGWVCALARVVAYDPNSADDLEQETWLRALQKPPRQASSLRAWLAEVLRSRQAGAGRTVVRERSTQERLSREIDATGAGPRRAAPSQPDEEAIRYETFQALAAALESLPESTRRAVWLRVIEGLEVQAVAAKLDVPVPTAQSRITRGLASLRGKLEGQFGDDWRQRCCVLATSGASTLSMASAASGTIVAGGFSFWWLGLVGVGVLVAAVAWTNSASEPERGSQRAPSEFAQASNAPMGVKPVVPAQAARVALTGAAAGRDSRNGAGRSESAESTVSIAGILVDEDDQGRTGEVWNIEVKDVATHRTQNVQLDPKSASFRLGGLSPGRYSILASSGFGDFAQATCELSAEADADLVLRFEGRLSDERLEVVLQLRDSWELRIPPEDVVLRDRNGVRVKESQLDLLGDLRDEMLSEEPVSYHLFRGLQLAPYTLSVESAGFEPVHVSDVSPGQRITRRMIPNSRLQFRVWTPDGQRINSYRIGLELRDAFGADHVWHESAQLQVANGSEVLRLSSGVYDGLLEVNGLRGRPFVLDADDLQAHRTRTCDLVFTMDPESAPADSESVGSGGSL